MTAYIPSPITAFSKQNMYRMLIQSRRNTLGVPQLSANQKKELVDVLAPIFFQEVAAPYDRLGQVVWERNRVDIDPRKPTVYYYISHAFFKGRSVLQVNYIVWYSDRKGPKAPWIERGHLDGITVRITLDPEGRPFMVDVMNNCGCYHFFVPRKESILRRISKPLKLDPFVPQWLPDAFPQKRLGIRVNSGWHQVQRLIGAEIPSDAISYQLVPYDVLEMLPHRTGRTESIFDHKGIAKGSQRFEHILLFPMGIPDVGSMRQRGHHAIELVGHAHFDDPDLFDRNFVFK